MNPKTPIVKRLKKEIEYESNVARCDTCVHIARPRVVMTIDSKTRMTPNFCKKHSFTVGINSVCSTWQSAEGEYLI